MIGIVNYGSGNLMAIANIYKNLNIDHKIVSEPEELASCDKLILPGVGSFDYNMSMMNKSGLRKSLDSMVLEKKTPVLGICLGLQIMAESSEEGELEGLGWIKAKVVKFDEKKIQVKPKVPHMGWNSIEVKNAPELFENVDPDVGFYFIHSYFIQVEDESNIMTTTEYGENFVSAVCKGNIFATQYHPEKSHSNGIQLLKNFANI